VSHGKVGLCDLPKPGDAFVILAPECERLVTPKTQQGEVGSEREVMRINASSLMALKAG